MYETQNDYICKLHGKYTTIRRRFFILLLLFVFTAGFLLAGLFCCRQGSRSIGRLDRRYALEHGRAEETVGKLAEELEREREFNRRLREHNYQAGIIAGGLAESAERNVRNLQEAILLIGEIRSKLKVLADFYTDSGSGGRSP